jgi:hypothetical protein
MRYSFVACFVCALYIMLVPVVAILTLVAMFAGKCYGNRHAGRYRTDWCQRAAAVS